MVNIISAFWGDKYSVEQLKKLPIDYCFSDKENRSKKDSTF